MEKQLSSFYARKGKYLLDYVLVRILLIFLSPLLGLITVLIKVSSKGPVLFRQKRVGLHNQLFMMYKFRTMSIDAPVYSEKPDSPDDPRITLLGRFLRQTSLDELPQLFNVFNGEMSLVGPRPEMPFLAEKYEEWENMRHVVRPGMTGLWQLSPGRREAIRDGICWDLEYIQNLSFRNDFKILFRTFKVFWDKNTY